MGEPDWKTDMFHPGWREEALASLAEPFDLVVLGGGINGCGVFFDAAQRGLRTLLVERDDLAAGTSSRSSKLIHGGLRYLRQLQFRVTRSSCRERDRLLRLSPHLVEPLSFLYPSYRSYRTPAWQIELGLRFYDRLTTQPQRHTRLSPDELAVLAPGLPREGLERALAYTDARADDARLTLAVAATGAAYGGQVLTRTTVEEGVRGADGRLRGLVLRDLESGGVHRVDAALVVNAAGVWVDRVRALLGCAGRRLQPSRGTHLIFPSSKLRLGAAVTTLSPDDRRPVFFIPHPEGVLVGTTDVFHHGELDDPRPTRAEVDYLLRAAAAAFPADPPTLDDALGAFAGLRPVLDDRATDPSRASREEAVWEEGGLVSVAGGKLTTWRLTAQETVDLARRRLGRPALPCATRGTPLAGLAPRDLGARLAAVHGLDEAVAAGMARRLGALAWTACALARDGELRPLDDGDLSAAEVRAHLRYGAVVRLSDLLLRRVRLGMWRPAVLADVVPRLRETVCAEMGWDAKRWDAERERLARDLEGWTLAGVAGEKG
jgi:glycerol-3-phosphate dehydrogenase